MNNSRYDNMLNNLALEEDGKVSWQGRPAIGANLSDGGTNRSKRAVKYKKVKRPKKEVSVREKS